MSMEIFQKVREMGKELKIFVRKSLRSGSSSTTGMFALSNIICFPSYLLRIIL